MMTQILQDKNGYRYSIDPFLLADFVVLPKDALVVDLGCGSGIIPILVGKVNEDVKITGLEIQVEMVDRSRRSVASSGLEGQIEIMHGDVRDLPKDFTPASFDVVVTNPPYRQVSAGRLSKGSERSLARHELAGGLVDFLLAARDLLKAKGRFYIIYISERLPELLSEMRRLRLEPKRLRMVHSRAGDDARLVLVEGRKNAQPGLRIERPLVIYKGPGRDYSDEMLKIYGLDRLAVNRDE